MIGINEYIFEKLRINKDTKVILHNGDNVDDFNNDDILLFSSVDEDSENDLYDDYISEIIEHIDDAFGGFVVCAHAPLSKTKNYEKRIIDYSENLQYIYNRIITGKDHGYEIYLRHGHLEFVCINSGSHTTYYVYALSNESYEKVESFFDGDNEVNSLDFLPKEVQEIDSSYI